MLHQAIPNIPKLLVHGKKSYRDPARKPLLALSPKGYVGEEDVGDEPV